MGQIIVDVLLAFTIAATFEAIQREVADVAGYFKIGSFELALLWSLCGVLLVTRILIPRINERRRVDRDEFRGLAKQAREVWHDSGEHLEGDERESHEHAKTLLTVHLRLLRVGFPDRESDTVLLITLMERCDLAKARKLLPLHPRG